jgi:hypothetical protein
MLFDKVNIHHELIKERDRSLLEEAKEALENAARTDADIVSRLHSGNENEKGNEELKPEDVNRVFTLDQIKKICITYRLRFLDSKYFKSDYPNEAVQQIAAFEKRYETKVKRFKIIAPDKAFDLQECNKDPLLFAQLDNNRFYLIHKWGNDLSWYRKFLYFPARTIYTYFFFMLAVAAVFAFITPFDWFQVKEDNIMYMRMWFTIHCFIGIFFMGIFLGATMQTSFSDMNWKSKYVNE